MTIFDDKNKVNLQEQDWVAMREEGKINVSDFTNGKIFSTVTDQNVANGITIYQTSRTQIKATYISAKDQIVELKLQKFENVKGSLQPPTEIRLDTKNLVTLTEFLRFLLSANLASVSAGRLSFAENISLDPELDSKLKALASDENGKQKLLELFNGGYLTSDFDIPELIQKGLSKEKIEEKRKILDQLQTLVDKPDVKEVSEIQYFLKNHPWIFGPEYKKIDFRDAGEAGNPDGRLMRIDGLSDVLEVKLPKAELLRTDKKERQYIAPELAEAIGQLTGYLEHYYSEYSLERDDETGKEIKDDRYGKYYKPKGILLIGRRSISSDTNSVSNTIDAHPKNLRRLLSYFHWIEVLTYDDLIERARNGLDNITK